MVSSPHEALHRIFRMDPGLFARLLPRAGIGFPEHTAIEPLDTDLTEIRPLERRVDSVFRVRVPGEESGFVLAVESQGKPDPDKHNSWTYYLAHMYAKYRLPPFLLVVCKDKATAAWASEPIRVGRAFHTSMVVFPLVLGPGILPVITEPDEAARDLGVAVFSALAYASDPGLTAILDALASGVADDAGKSGDVDRVDWAEIVEIGLGEGPGRDYWRHLMATYTPNFPGSNSIVEESWLEGKAEGKAETVLRILEVRGVEIPDFVRERVTACADLDVLGTWIDRSLSVVRAEELFVEE
ncbi:hypothetical protein STPH2_4324 [Streptomyces sp. KO7888]|uniref:hypothetical protein n=1 Tax=Streptomyces TaxID=1883 RepID=UPI0012908BCA|nr:MULTISPECIES: hypothetical protein [Streptomyces]MCX5037139.1 hypothetical protein [Streptomyces coelicoflavus]NHI08958.1 hypothetical protein [Streptomyces sp. KO7888]QFX83307.1 hypothetical protein GEV49_22190 [Streptomyces sp. SYP-A7193]